MSCLKDNLQTESTIIYLFCRLVDCCGAVASVRDSNTVDLSSFPVRLVVASW